MEKVIIDTDPAIGVPLRDIDDGLAITLALRSPELDVAGLTVTYGNTSLGKAVRSAKKVLKAAGREDVPVLAGAASKNDLGRETDASRFIAGTIGEAPGEVSLLTLGPLTNAATAEMRRPGTLAAARRVVAMGAAVFGPGIMPPFFLAEFNFWNDPAASDIFVRNSCGLALVPCELTLRVAFGSREMRMLRQSDSPLARFIYRNSVLWHAAMSAVYLRDGFPPHDPLAVALMTAPELFRTRTAHIRVKQRGPARGWTRRGSDGAAVTVATSVDKRAFLDLLVGRLCS